MHITFLKEEEHFTGITDWVGMIQGQLEYISKNLSKYPVGTEERNQYIEIFIF